METLPLSPILPPPIHFRFTHGSEADLQRLQHFVIGQYKPVRLLIVLEEADEEVNRDHTHSAIYIPVDKKKFSTAVRKNFPIHKGNSAFSVDADIRDSYALECYLCKGKAKHVMPKVLETTLTPQEILERHLAYWEKNEELKKDKKDKKDKKISWTLLTANSLKQKYPSRKFRDDETDRFIIFEHVLECLGKDAKVFDVFILRRLTLGVMNMLLTNHHERKDFAKMLFRQTFPSSYETGENYDLMV